VTLFPGDSLVRSAGYLIDDDRTRADLAAAARTSASTWAGARLRIRARVEAAFDLRGWDGSV
jgi:hypothetical protein